MLCWRHHRLIHEPVTHPDNGWRLRMIDGLPWAIPPAWLDPAQKPLRNTLRQAINRTRHTAQQMTLDYPLRT